MKLHPGEIEYTWGIDGKKPFPPSRVHKTAMLGLRAKEIEVINPGVFPEGKSSGEVGDSESNNGEASDPIPVRSFGP